MTKGLVMILTVYSHCGLSLIPILGAWVYGFYMPLFFFVSGILLNLEKYTLSSFLRRRWKTLYRPYIIFSAILAILCFPLHINDYHSFYKTLLINGWGGYALWFIPVLALAELLFLLISKFTNCRYIQAFIAIISLFVGFALYRINCPNQYNWTLVPTAMAFYTFGNIFRNFMNISRSRILILLIASLFASLLCFLNPEKPEWFINKLVSLWTFPAALGGTLFICTFMMYTERYIPSIVTAILKYVGKNTFLILAFHQIILQLVHRSGLIPNGSLNGSLTRISMWIILVGIIELVNHKCPQLLGKNKCQ